MPSLDQLPANHPQNRRLIFEEGTHSNWLHEVLAPHVQEAVVVAVRQSRGPKDDERDAFGLAEDLRIGNVKVQVYKKQGEFAKLSHLDRSAAFFSGLPVHFHVASLSISTSIGGISSGREECGRSQLYLLIQSPIPYMTVTPLSNSCHHIIPEQQRLAPHSERRKTWDQISGGPSGRSMRYFPSRKVSTISRPTPSGRSSG